MRFIDSENFTAGRPWGALDIAGLDDATVRPHWTDRPYIWEARILVIERRGSA